MRKSELQRRLEQAHEDQLELARECARLQEQLREGEALLARATAEVELATRLHAQVAETLQSSVARERDRADRLEQKLLAYAGVDEEPVTGRSAYRTEDDELAAARQRFEQLAEAQVEAELAGRGIPVEL